MDENNKDTNRLVPLQNAMGEIFGDYVSNVKNDQKSKLHSVSDMANCGLENLPEGITVNFNPTINVVSANSDSRDQTSNNPSLSEVGKFMTALAGVLSMFVK